MNTIEANYLDNLYNTEFKDSVHDVSEKRAKSYLLFDTSKVKHSYIILPKSPVAPTEFKVYARVFSRTGQALIRELTFSVVKTERGCNIVLKEKTSQTTLSSPRLFKLFLQNLDVYHPPQKENIKPLNH